MKFLYLHENESYTIKRYYPLDNENDKSFIKEHKKELWLFFDNGYKAAGFDGFSKSCFNERSLSKNASALKLCYFKDNLIAASVYTSSRDGFKCIGITVTTDELLKPIGIIAVKNIIAEDIGLQNQFYWCECSHAIEHLYKKNNAVQIPACYAYLFIQNKDLTIIDYYHFSYNSLYDNEPLVKTIFGVNNKKTLDVLVNQTYNTELSKQLKSIFNISESVPDSKFDKIVLFLQTIQDVHTEGVCEFLPEVLEGTKKCVDYLKEKNKTVTDPIERRQINAYINAGEDVIESSTNLVWHKELLGLK